MSFVHFELRIYAVQQSFSRVVLKILDFSRGVVSDGEPGEEEAAEVARTVQHDDSADVDASSGPLLTVPALK